MFQPRLLACVAVFFMILASLVPAQDDAVAKQLAVQAAMTRARAFLSDLNAQKAVDVLEEQLAKVNGNPQYLVLLREAYRANIRDLHLKGQPADAKRYLDRLAILDPSAAADTALRPQVDAPPRKFDQEQPKQTGLPFPSFSAIKNLFGKKDDAKKPATADEVVARAVPETAIEEDPFDKKNQRTTPGGADKSAQARELVTRGLSEFSYRRYPEAKHFFEEAYRTDQTSLTTSREAWAYCILDSVTKAMEQPGAKFGDLHKQVEGAIEMAPGKVMAEGQRLLRELERRGKTAGAPVVTASLTNVKHWGQNKEGWQVASTKHFHIFHKQNNEFAERVAQIAENTRVTMYRKWFDADGVEWDPICELIMHPNVSSYTHMTGAPANSPGHARVDADRDTKRVIKRRMDLRCDIPTMMEAVLPHEATHVVLAGMFGPYHVPRWADEGIAVLSEPKDKIDAHRRNLLKNHREGLLFGLKELMEMENYPQQQTRVGAFYAQSVMLADFLAKQRGPRVLPEFVKDGLRQGYEAALRKHYGMTFPQLEQLWRQQVIEQAERVAAQ